MLTPSLTPLSFSQVIKSASSVINCSCVILVAVQRERVKVMGPGVGYSPSACLTQVRSVFYIIISQFTSKCFLLILDCDSLSSFALFYPRHYSQICNTVYYNSSFRPSLHPFNFYSVAKLLKCCLTVKMCQKADCTEILKNPE